MLGMCVFAGPESICPNLAQLAFENLHFARAQERHTPFQYLSIEGSGPTEQAETYTGEADFPKVSMEMHAELRDDTPTPSSLHPKP